MEYFFKVSLQASIYLLTTGCFEINSLAMSFRLWYAFNNDMELWLRWLSTTHSLHISWQQLQQYAFTSSAWYWHSWYLASFKILHECLWRSKQPLQHLIKHVLHLEMTALPSQILQLSIFNTLYYFPMHKRKQYLWNINWYGFHVIGFSNYAIIL